MIDGASDAVCSKVVSMVGEGVPEAVIVGVCTAGEDGGMVESGAADCTEVMPQDSVIFSLKIHFA